MSQIRRTDPIVQPTRRAHGALETHFDRREMYVPEDDAGCVELIRRAEARLARGAGGGGRSILGGVGGDPEEHVRVGDVIVAAMSGSEATCVRAIELLARLPESVLRAFEGELFALVQVHMLRREPRRVLLTPPLEALLRHLPFWPDRAPFSYGVPNAPTMHWPEEVRTFLRRSSALDDPALPELLAIAERFPRLHAFALDRLLVGPGPTPEAAGRLASRYEPAVLPLVRHGDERVAEEARKVASVWLDRIELPTSPPTLERFGHDPSLLDQLGRTRAELLRIVVDEHRPDLVTEDLGTRALGLLRQLWRDRELERLHLHARGHRFLILASLSAPADEVDPAYLERLVELLTQPGAPDRTLATVLSHPNVDEPLLERLLAAILEKGGRIIDQSRRLAHPLFPHHRPAFRRAMIEGYRRTIGSPWLVEAVFMATPPEELHESLRFLMANNAQSLPTLVRRWIGENPGGGGRTRIPAAILRQLKSDSNAGMALAGSLLEEYQQAVPESAEFAWSLDLSRPSAGGSGELVWDL